jgi:hypothetical protein
MVCTYAAGVNDLARQVKPFLAGFQVDASFGESGPADRVDRYADEAPEIAGFFEEVYPGGGWLPRPDPQQSATPGSA